MDECERDIAVGQERDRGLGITSCERLGEPDLAANLVAGGVVSLPDDGVAAGVEREARVIPADEVTPIRQGDDLAVELVSGARGVSLSRGFPKMGGRGHGVLRLPIISVAAVFG